VRGCVRGTGDHAVHHAQLHVVARAEHLGLDTAVLGIVIASAVNNLVKAGLTVWQGSARLWRLVIVPMVASLLLGLLVAVLG